MATVNNISAVVNPTNPGIYYKAIDPSLIKGILFVPKGTTITSAQLSNLYTLLKGLSLNDAKSARLYEVGNLVDFKDNSEKAVTQSFGYGPEYTVRDGLYKWQFQFRKGKKPLNDALRSFNGDDWDVFFVDYNNVLWGQTYVDDEGNEGLQAIPIIEVYTNPFGLNDGKKLADYLIDVKFEPKYINELGAFIDDAGFQILDELPPIQDVVVTGVADATSGTYDVTIKTKFGFNLFDQYNSTTSGFAQVGVFKFTNATSGATIAVTGVVANAAGQNFKVTVSPTDPAYPTGSGKVQIDLVGPTELDAAGVTGFESLGPIQITKN